MIKEVIMKRGFMVYLLLIMGMFSLGEAKGSGYSASFDCSKARSRIEKLICSDEKLAGLDKRMLESYKRAKKLQPKKAKSIIKAQRAWVRDRNRCKTKKGVIECLIAKYEARLVNLDIEDVIVPVKNAKYVGSFTQTRDMIVESIVKANSKKVKVTDSLEIRKKGDIYSVKANYYGKNYHTCNFKLDLKLKNGSLLYQKNGCGFKIVKTVDGFRFIYDKRNREDSIVNLFNCGSYAGKIKSFIVDRNR